VTLANKPIRMCIICKKRFFQSDLIRLQCKNLQIIHFTQIGRSFYLCKECFKLDQHKIEKALFRQCKSNKIDFNKQRIKDLL